MTTYASQPMRHPWFNSPLKRKLSNMDDERRRTSHSSPSPTSRSKRRKFNTLEHGFAHLTLSSALVQPDLRSGPIAHPTGSPSSSEFIAHPPNGIVFPGSIEEAARANEALVPEVSMEYEEGREDISGIAMASADLTSDYGAARFTVSTPFLERLQKHQTAPHNFIPLCSPGADAGALVLYRPLRPPLSHTEADEHAECIEEVVTPSAATLLEENLEDGHVDEDAMDVE